MLLSEEEKPFNSKKYLYETKFDGIRALIFVGPKDIEVRTRNNQEITYLYPELLKLKSLVTKKVIFDGEIVLMFEGRPSFKALSKRHYLKNKAKITESSMLNPVVFIAFDILYENKNLTNLPLIERKKILDKYKDNDIFIKVRYLKEEGIKLFKTIKKLNLEGIVAKKIDSPYEISTRSPNWIKIKNIKTDTFYIGGYIEKINNHVISLLLGKYQDKEFTFMGKVTLGKKSKLYNDIKKLRPCKKTPFANYEEKGVIYLKPKLTTRVSYLNLTNNHHLRHPFIP